MNFESSIFFPVFRTESAIKVGCCIDDFATLRTTEGSYKKIKLNRVRYKFRSRPDDPQSQIAIPSFDGEVLSYDLFLGQTSDGRSGSFILQSNNEIPFKLNGVNCLSAYIERDDQAMMGYNRIEFLSAEERDLADKHFSSFFANKRLIKSDLNILIEGETGTGKTRLARRIHVESERSGPFVHINLSAFSSGLVESELFGHVKGAFTGAHSDKRGAFLQANGGTLFLDEIDSVSRELQTKLLLFLDSHEIRPVGGDGVKKCDVRMIFASGRSMEKLVEKGDVRKDFYFRLISGHTIFLKSLRNEQEEIRRLSREFEQKEMVLISKELLAFYETLPWPGNKRQFIAHLNKKKILSKSKKLTFDKFDDQLICQSSDLLSLSDNSFCPLNEYRDQYAVRVYNHFDENLRQSAKVLNISDNTLRQIIKKYRTDKGFIHP